MVSSDSIKQLDRTANLSFKTLSSSLTRRLVFAMILTRTAVDRSQCKFASQIIATVGLGVTKASVLVFYVNIFITKRFKIWAYFMLGIVTAWTISFFFSNLFTCYPITALVEAFYGNNCVNGPKMWYASCITDFITGFMILATPVPMVLKLQVHWHQKLAIQGMFALGAL